MHGSEPRIIFEVSLVVAKLQNTLVYKCCHRLDTLFHSVIFRENTWPILTVNLFIVLILWAPNQGGDSNQCQDHWLFFVIVCFVVFEEGEWRCFFIYLFFFLYNMLVYYFQLAKLYEAFTPLDTFIISYFHYWIILSQDN